MNEKELREKIFIEIEMKLRIGFENCAFLGRQAMINESYGDYTEKMVKMIKHAILNPQK